MLPSIDYCSAIWDPYTKNDISKLEMLQHWAAHFVMNKLWYRQCNNVGITKILHSKKTLVKITCKVF